MQPQHYLNVDLARVYDAMGKGRKLLTTLCWGDPVEVLEQTPDHIRISTVAYREDKKDKSFRPVKVDGYIPLKKARIQAIRPLAENPVLKVDFVDVQQGDGCVVEAPHGEIVLIDGGEEQLFARYLANRFPGTKLDKPKVVDCILVTHGDADHFAGLVKIQESEEHDTARKRLFIEPRHVYHNGLVKGPSTDGAKRKVKDEKLFGATKQTAAGLLVTALHNNLLEVPKKAMNAPFLKWREVLKTWQSRTEDAIDIRRIACGDNAAFGFLTSNNPGLEVEVLGPTLARSNGTTGLKFLGPPSKPRLVNETLDLDDAPQSTAISASHTINGHSIVLRMKYKNIRFLFSGDLNEESERQLVDGNADLQAEVLKVPHHGSADFSPRFLGKVQPIISVVSSGDENTRKEYIHPRANLMASLGRYSRDVEPVVFVTEMVAFFKTVGYVTAELTKKAKRRFFAFERAAFGIVKVRTDGERLLVYTNSGLEKLKEAYVFRVEASGQASPEALRVL